MEDVKNTEKSNKPKADKPGSFQQSIISEQIKKRPINKYRLLRKTAITALLAILFGIVASITIWLLEPVLSKWVSKPEPAAGDLIRCAYPDKEEHDIYDDSIDVHE